jgi:hypothetical protein
MQDEFDRLQGYHWISKLSKHNSRVISFIGKSVDDLPFSTVVEEYLHLQQSKFGAAGTLEQLAREVEVNNFLVQNAKRLGIGDNELQIIEANLADWMRQLADSLR